MSSESSNQILASELARIVESVFATMLEIEVHECETPWSPNGENLTAVLHMAGDWSGVVLFECGRRQACNFVSRYLSIDPPKGVDDTVRDVLGELVSVIGGNVKFLLAPGIRLSTPSVVNGNEYCLQARGTVVINRLAFRCADAPIWVTILGKRLA